MKHTPTPWEIRGNIIFVANSYKSIATIHVCENYDILKGERIRDVEQEANANRIVDCVEALEGVENPKEFMEFVNREPSEKVRHLLRLNERIKALEEALKMSRQYVFAWKLKDIQPLLGEDLEADLAKIDQLLNSKP